MWILLGVLIGMIGVGALIFIRYCVNLYKQLPKNNMEFDLDWDCTEAVLHHDAAAIFPVEDSGSIYPDHSPSFRSRPSLSAKRVV